MQLKPRRTEEPEINVTSLIDVVLLLVVFFMLSSNFSAEGRLRIRLPQANEQATDRAAGEALVVTVSASGAYLVNGRELDQFRARYSACSGPQEHRQHPARNLGHHSRRRPREPPVGSHGDGRSGTSWLHADERRHTRRARSGYTLNRAAAGNIASASNIEQAGGVYRRLLRYARPYAGVYLLGVIGMMMYAGTDLLTINFTKTYLQNSMALERNHQLLRWLPFWVLGIFLFRGAGDYLANYFPFWVGRQVIKAIRTDLFAHYLRLPTAIYDRESSGTMLSRLTYNAETVAAATTDSLTVIIRDSLSIAFNIGALFWLNWKLAIYALLVAPAIAWLVRSVNVRFRRYSARIQNSMGDVTRVVKETLDAHRVVKVFNAQDHIAQLFENANELNRRTNVRLSSARSSSNPTVQMIAAVGLAFVLYIANREMAAGVLSVASFIPFLIALFQVTQPLKRVLNVSGPMQQGIAAGASVFAVLDSPTEPEGGTQPLAARVGMWSSVT